MMKKIYKSPTLNTIDLEKNYCELINNSMGDGEQLVKGEIFVVDEEEQRTAYTNYNIWDEEW